MKFYLTIITLVLFTSVAPGQQEAQDSASKNTYRIIISSDFPPLDVIPGGAGHGPAEKRSDPDDIQSMVRFLLYANEFDVEGLIASSGTFANIANKQNILDILDLYDQVYENLRKHDSKYPSADYFRSVTFEGSSGNWGKADNVVLGEGKDSEASEAIIEIVNRSVRSSPDMGMCLGRSSRSRTGNLESSAYSKRSRFGDLSQ
ncbi:MAG: DUF1593 domain-containing protein [Cyclobacteriaceae bacterium]|nr:DUF1593 domain-containing protein [Cyclobacteriaceae bacterium]